MSVALSSLPFSLYTQNERSLQPLSYVYLTRIIIPSTTHSRCNTCSISSGALPRQSRPVHLRRRRNNLRLCPSNRCRVQQETCCKIEPASSSFAKTSTFTSYRHDATLSNQK